MRVLVDTNVLVSAILRDKDSQSVILWIASREDWEWVVSPEILAEYKEVLARRKFNLPDELLQQWYSYIDQLTNLQETDFSIKFDRDPKDEKFIACALSVNAEYFITGDKDFAQAEKLINTTIIPVSMFKRLIVDPDQSP